MSDTLKEFFFSVSKWDHQNGENHFPTSQGIYPSAIAGNLYYHLQLKELISRGVPVKVCGTCMARCGIHKNQPYFAGADKSTMPELAQWVIDSDKVLTF